MTEKVNNDNGLQARWTERQLVITKHSFWAKPSLFVVFRRETANSKYMEFLQHGKCYNIGFIVPVGRNWQWPTVTAQNNLCAVG